MTRKSKDQSEDTILVGGWNENWWLTFQDPSWMYWISTENLMSWSAECQHMYILVWCAHSALPGGHFQKFPNGLNQTIWYVRILVHIWELHIPKDFYFDPLIRKLEPVF